MVHKVKSPAAIEKSDTAIVSVLSASYSREANAGDMWPNCTVIEL